MLHRSDPNKQKVQKNLTKSSFLQAVNLLANQDRDLKFIISAYGPPPFWRRRPGFPTLLYIILEQQVSLASARAAYRNLVKAVKPLIPQNFIRLTDAELQVIGFSRQKTRYGRVLASSIIDGSVDLLKLNRYEDAAVKEKLMSIKGIGPWTADIYLLLAMGRPDIWPNGDLAIAAAVQRLAGMPVKPSAQDLSDLAEQWRPWRSVAARFLWHFYLNYSPDNI
jgi:DNA-3-methyladenine glycosylase II